MAATTPRSTTPPTPHPDDAPPRHRRAGTFLLRLLEELGSHPSVWDPWLLLTPHRTMGRTLARR